MLRLLLLLPFFFNLVVMPDGDDETFSWGERPLSWADFRGTPPTKIKDHTVAQASSIILLNSVSHGTEGTRAEIKVVFNPESSWVLPGYRNPIVLNHEQRHFDIAEYHARRMRAGLRSHQHINAVFDRISIDCDRMQERYDRETRHGTDLREQAIWDHKIGALLKSMDAYQSTTIWVR